MRVVNMSNEDWDLRIDRATIWGNPYSHKDGTLATYKVATRKEAIEKYREYILDNPELLAKLHELKGKVLGCWCAPLPCHGDVLIELIERLEYKVDLENI